MSNVVHVQHSLKYNIALDLSWFNFKLLASHFSKEISLKTERASKFHIARKIVSSIEFLNFSSKTHTQNCSCPAFQVRVYNWSFSSMWVEWATKKHSNVVRLWKSTQLKILFAISIALLSTIAKTYNEITSWHFLCKFSRARICH